MTARDCQIVVTASRWSDEENYLKQHVAKYRLPNVAQIIQGQYGELGVPSQPSPGLQSTALLVSAGKRKKIIAQPIKFKEGTQMVRVGPRIAIPDTYKGYFELLSEEGRAARCIESVAELAKRRLEYGCLVREPIRAICGKTDLKGTVTVDGKRNLLAGEVIMPKKETYLGKNKFLMCTDYKGDTILLSFDQRGKFSAVAKEEDIGGVHTAKTLLQKRLPITVRLVHGTSPHGLKKSKHFAPELRLLSVIEEEHVFALPLQKKDNALVALPLAAPIKLQRCKNEDQIKGLMEFSRIVEKCNLLLMDVADKMHVLYGILLNAPLHAPPIVQTGYFLRRSASLDTANQNKLLARHSLNYSSLRDENLIPVEYDEIDQIYDYAGGRAPLPNIKASFYEAPEPIYESVLDSTVATRTPIHMPFTEMKPEPPPIETIPSRKQLNQKAETRTRRTTIAANEIPITVYKERCSSAPAPNLPKLYIKNVVNIIRVE